MNGIDYDPRPSMALYLAGPDLEIRKPRKKSVDQTSADRQIEFRSGWRFLGTVLRRLTVAFRGTAA